MENRTPTNQKESESKPLLQADESAQQTGPIDFSKRVSNIDDGYTGQKMPARLGKGPVSNRTVTDIICCICFALFIVIFILICILYSIRGSVSKATELVDSEGNTCGVDEKVANKPYLYFFKFDPNYKSVCVSECPKFDYNQIKYNSTGNESISVKFEPLYAEDLKSKTDPAWKAPDPAYTKKYDFDYDEKFARGYYTKDQWDAYIARFQIDCYQNADVPTCKNDPSKTNYIYDSRLGSHKICNIYDPSLASFFDKINSLLRSTKSGFDNLLEAKWMLLISVFTAFIVALLFLALCNLIMPIIIWVQLGITLLFCAALAVMFFFLAFGDQTETLRKNGYSQDVIESYQNLKAKKVES